MAFNINEMTSQLNKRGYMPANKFQVTFNLPPAFTRADADYFHYDGMVRDIGFWIDGASLPGIMLNTAEVRSYGYGQSNQRAIVPTFPPLQLRVMTDATGMAWELFKRWINKVINYDSRLGMSRDTGQITTENAGGNRMQTYESSYPLDYCTSLVISVYTPDGNELKRVVVTEAYPSALSDVELAWDNNDQIGRFTVQMAYNDWFTERT